MDTKKIIYGVLGFLALVGSAWGVTEIFVLKPVYEIELAGVSSQILQMQRNNQIQWAQQQVFYWDWQEKQKMSECTRRADKQQCQYELNAIRRERQAAEQNLRLLHMQK